MLQIWTSSFRNKVTIFSPTVLTIINLAKKWKHFAIEMNLLHYLFLILKFGCLRIRVFGEMEPLTSMHTTPTFFTSTTKSFSAIVFTDLRLIFGSNECKAFRFKFKLSGLFVSISNFRKINNVGEMFFCRMSRKKYWILQVHVLLQLDLSDVHETDPILFLISSPVVPSIQ